MRQRNPLDPLDDYKRWYADLWPMERAAVGALLVLVLVAVAFWVTRG